MDESPEQLDTLSLAFVEGLYADYLRDPESVSPDWRSYFEETSHGNGDGAENGATLNAAFRLGPSFRAPSLFSAPRLATNGYGVATEQMNVAILQDRLDQLVRAYRVRGHLIAQIDPLGLPRPELPELDPAFYHFADGDFDRTFSTDTIEGPQQMTLRQIVARLRNTYCRFIGVQFMHMDDLRVRQWLQDRMERTENRCYLSRKEQLKILKRLTDAVIFEEFIQKRFQGAKSFSLEGAESLIPLLELAIEKAGEQKTDEIVLAMAHRGRLNVLANIMGKSPQQIFREFADIDPELHIGRGDVKYHLGYSNDWTTRQRSQGPSLALLQPQPPGVRQPGRRRPYARQAGPRRTTSQRSRGMVVLIHGDAAFAGEGIIQETLNLSQLPGYKIGGTLHVVVNNQIGFTTSPSEAPQQHLRHRRGEDAADSHLPRQRRRPRGGRPSACAWRMDFRREFQRDVVIDMYCYRRRGHNEEDEPSFTQPLLYKAIKQRKNVREGYLDHLLKLGGVTREEADRIVDEQREKLEKELTVARSEHYVPRTDIGGFWSFYIGGREREAAEVDTGMSKDKLAALLEGQTKLPDGFTPHPTVERTVLAPRREMARGEQPLDWGGAEALGLRQPRRTRAPRAHERAGHRARHLQPPPRRPPRHQRRPHLHAAQACHPRSGPHRNLQQPAQRKRRPRLRVRLQPRLPRRPRPLGSAVRRLRQRRPGDHRSVHRQRRRKMEPPLRHCAAPAARFRRARPRAQSAPASNASSHCPPKTTSRSATSPRPHNTSTASAARCCASGANRW